MAQWSVKAEEEKKAQRFASILAERASIFAQFRAGGWEINVVNPSDERNFVKMSDTWIGDGFTYDFRVKMPGAYPMRIKNMAQLLRMVKGVS